MTDMTAEKATALRKPFPPESVGKLPKGGAMLDFVGHAAVTDRLLTVDPNWSWDFSEVDPTTGHPSLRHSLDPEGNLWIRLTICGVSRIGVGDGKSAKERIGDAIRNAAMRFGVALDLWAKENLVEFAQAANVTRLPNPTPPPPEPHTPPPEERPMSSSQRGQMFALFGQKGIEEDQQLAGVNAITGATYESRGDLTFDHAKQVIEALKKRPNVALEESPA